MFNDDYPIEIVITILSYLDGDDILNYIDVSKYVRCVLTQTVRQLTGAKKRAAMCSVSRYNNLKLFKYLIDLGCPIQSENLCKFAAEVGALNIIQWLYENRFSTQYTLEIVKWDIRFGFDNLKVISEIAALHGHVIILKWLISIKYRFKSDIAIFAVRGHQHNVIQWLFDNKLLDVSFHLYKEAVASRNTQFLIWTKDNSFTIREPLVNWTFFHGNNIFHKRAYMGWTDNIYSEAIFKEDLEMIKCLNSYICKWNAETCLIACWYGKILVLEFLRSNQCPIDIKECYHLAYSGTPNCHIIDWLNNQKL